MRRSKLSQINASILVNSIYAMQNFPIILINTLLSPLSFLLVISFVSRGSLTQVAIEGAFMMTMISSGIGLQGDLSHLKNDFKLQDMVVSSPTKAQTYILGMAISELVYSIPAFIVLLILGVIFVSISIAGILTILVVLMTVFTFSIVLGFMLSTISTDIIQSWAFAGIISMFLSTIPPVYYPITYIPLPYRYVAYLSPTTYAAEIVQNASGFLSLSGGQILLDWIILITVTIVLFLVALKMTRWREP